MNSIRWERDARADLRRYRRWLIREAGDAVAASLVASKTYAIFRNRVRRALISAPAFARSYSGVGS